MVPVRNWNRIIQIGFGYSPTGHVEVDPRIRTALDRASRAQIKSNEERQMYLWSSAGKSSSVVSDCNHEIHIIDDISR